MKVIDNCSRITPGFNKGWDAYRTLVMDGHRSIQSISEREPTYCDTCSQKLNDAQHVLLECPKFEPFRLEAYEKTRKAMDQAGLTQKTYDAMDNVRTLNENDVLEGLRTKLGASQVDRDLFDEPMSARAMAMREACGMKGLNKILLSKYHIQGERRKALMRNDGVRNEQMRKLASEDYVQYVKLKQYVDNNHNLGRLLQQQSWLAFGRIYPRIHDALNVSGKGFITACWEATFIATFCEITDNLW